jgi:hypothetical protein
MLVAAAIAVTALVALELGWRALGFVPMPRDTPHLWAMQREQVRDSRNVVVVIGSSRAQLGLDPDALTAELGLPSYQLSITGGSPLPVLEDLADDERFRGVVICEVTPSAFFIRPSSIREQSGGEWVRSWSHLPLVTAFETRMRVWLQSRTVLLLPHTNLRFQLSALLTTRQFTGPSITHQRADRFHMADYSREDLPAMIAHWSSGLRRSAANAASSNELGELARLVESWVSKIRERGGDVIFVRIVSSSTVLETEDELWPRERFWDPFVRHFEGRAIYFADHVSLSGFTAPEGSHLDAPQASQFSRALARILCEKGWLARRAGACAAVAN